MPGMPTPYTRSLETDGIAVIPGLLGGEPLRAAQAAFASRLKRMRWNDFDGFEMTEPHRHMVQDVLTLEQGFVDLALHPAVKETLSEYIGERYELVEAKGWRSMPTRKDFHGWHGDAWYDQGRVAGVPREVKLAFYLTDVRSGAFQYIKGTHGRQAPRPVKASEVSGVPGSQVLEVNGPAGTAILFDTSGIHRQAVPILERRHAVFYNYHDPSVPLQREDLNYYRYHPLTLNAALLGGLTAEDRRVLGFGNKANYIPAHERRPRHTGFQALTRLTYDALLRVDVLRERVAGKLSRLSRPAPGEPAAGPAVKDS
jgi:hypothetical protein